MNQILNGKAYAAQWQIKMREQIQTIKAQGKRLPGLAVILVGGDPASTIYVRNKRHACEEIGIISFNYSLPATVSEAELVQLIAKLNHMPEVDGILLQLPLPDHIDGDHVLESIDPKKDVDGFHPYNLGRLAQRRPLLRPCTPLGVMLLLNSINEPFKKRHAVVVGASNIVGRPMALELLIAGATVTICHRFTEHLDRYVKEADILVSAVGKPGLIKGDWIKPGATVIDIGITRLADGTLAGDIEFDKAKTRAAWITPVPGGVGPMTVTALLHNTILAAGYDPS
jgi:methylenetetrahydrofolate dehydrogenase (NADP+) / methenyltetrahydrofolate cyclohydrolase